MTYRPKLACMSDARSMRTFFVGAAGRGADIEVWIDHPVQDFCLQRGVCLEGNDDYLVMGPRNQPGRVCIPYHSIRWFRAMDEQ